MFDDLKSMHKHYEKEEKQDELTFSPEIKRKTLIALLVTLGIGNMQLSNLAIVLPFFIEKNEDWETDS